MDAYTICFILGGLGLCLMAFSGVARFGGHSAGHHGGGARHTTHHSGGGRSGFKSTLLALASPRILFSLLFGFGLAGTIAHHYVDGFVLAGIAVAGAVVFDRGLVAPVWNFFMRFASNPAMTFDTSIMSEARAALSFDANGQGLVAVEVDGQIVQCLGTLRPEDRALGIRVRAGDTVMVEDVDTARQRCIVSYVGRGVDQMSDRTST